MNLSSRIRLHVLLTIQLIYYPHKFKKNGIFFFLHCPLGSYVISIGYAEMRALCGWHIFHIHLKGLYYNRSHFGNHKHEYYTYILD